MNPILDILHYTLLAALCATFISDAVILFIRSKTNRVRQILGCIVLMYGLTYLFSIIKVINLSPEAYTEIWRTNTMIVANFCISSMIFLPYETFLPRQLNLKRVLSIYMPAILMTLFYYIVMYIGKMEHIELYNYKDLFASLGHFDVWYRFIFLAANITYIMYILLKIYAHEKIYIRWKEENFSDNDHVDSSWMRDYGYIIVIIAFFYLITLSCGGKLPVILHSTVMYIAINYLFYKGLTYESLYPATFMKKTDEEEVVPAIDPGIILINEEINTNINSFETKITEYCESLKAWMENEKPFLYKDFKLSDVARVLPLNRSYLSRVFNEGYGKNFSEVVREYRVNHSKEILKKHGDLPLIQIADAAGFHSASTFIKAFKEITGMTPTQFKAESSQKQA